jgi:nitrogen fixation protein FixH
MTRRFTGRHMLAAMLAFFGVILAVNMAMATLATRTFGGVVVENSYVASQEFNAWLAAARAQRKLGWSAHADMIDGHVLVTLRTSGWGARRRRGRRGRRASARPRARYRAALPRDRARPLCRSGPGFRPGAGGFGCM